ncbi:hypothetical protein [Nostoc sp.]
MTPIPQPFTQAENDWHLASLCQDITSLVLAFWLSDYLFLVIN